MENNRTILSSHFKNLREEIESIIRKSGENPDEYEIQIYPEIEISHIHNKRISKDILKSIKGIYG